MTVTHKQNIYIQTLMDCSILEAKTDQFIKVNFKVRVELRRKIQDQMDELTFIIFEIPEYVQ